MLLPIFFAAALLGSTAADVVNGNTNRMTNAMPPTQFAESRDSSWGPASSTLDSSSFSSASGSPPAVTYSTGNSFYSSDPGWGFDQQQQQTYPVQAGGFFSSDLINTGITIVLGLFAVSLIVHIVGTILATGVLANVFKEARSLSSDDMVLYTNMAMNAYNKFEELNFLPKDVPK